MILSVVADALRGLLVHRHSVPLKYREEAQRTEVVVLDVHADEGSDIQGGVLEPGIEHGRKLPVFVQHLFQHERSNHC